MSFVVATQHPEVRYGDVAVFAVEQEGDCCEGVGVDVPELLFRGMVPACEWVADDEVRQGASSKLAEEDEAAVAVGYLPVLGGREEVEDLHMLL